MNFSNLPAQLIAIFLGWVFTLFIQRRANIRSEAIRKKDKLIDRIEKLVDWVEKAYPIEDDLGAMSEEIYSAYVSQIEMRIITLDRLLKQDAVGTELVSSIRTIDILDKCKHANPVKEARLAAFDLIEALEIACDLRYFAKKTLEQHANRFIYEFSGVAAACMALIFSLALAKYACTIFFLG